VTGLDLAPATLSHPAFHGVTADLTDAASLQRAAAALARRRRTPQALVHAAGVLRTGRVGELPPRRRG
jgi:3-oxoacyl-[acyl-carrier protein] reductase